MTLCITALSESKIILCFDRQVGDDISTSEYAFKCTFPLGTFKMCALQSGTMDQAQDILAACITCLGPKHLTLENYKEEIWTAYRNGTQALARRGIEKTDVQFIVSGFVDWFPTITYVDCEQLFGDPRFLVIGSGMQVADAMLRWRNPSPSASVSEMMYYVYEAKKLGEMSPHVGKETVMYVMSSVTRDVVAYEPVTSEMLADLDADFRRFGPQRYLKTTGQRYPGSTTI